MTRSFTLIEGGESRTVEASVDGDCVRIAPERVHALLGWELRAEGLCRGDVCVPVRDREALLSQEGLDLEALAEVLDRPIVLDLAEGAVALGVAASERAAAMADLEAPDFTLPDLSGRMHSLRDHLGDKVLLIVYASW